jgi:hypothetical protein
MDRARDIHLSSALTGDVITGATRLTTEDRNALVEAIEALEHTSLAGRLTAVLGRQIELAGKLVPANVAQTANKAAVLAVKSALRLAMISLANRPVRDSRRMHKAVLVLSGAAGGAFGLTSLPVELPVSTTLMLRSIADIARTEGEDLSQPETALACLQVFALGAQRSSQNSVGSGNDVQSEALIKGGYFAMRGILAKSISEAASYIVERGLADEGAPAIMRLVSQIASRFGMVVTQKFAAQAIPFIGAAGGAAINYAFVDHFQKIARGHFTVRRLERKYGSEMIRSEYEVLLQQKAHEANAA